MRPVNVIQGAMVPLPRADVDTDQIIPKQFLTRIERTGYGAFLFWNWAYDDDGNPVEFFTHDPARRGAKVLVAGPNFGCGSSREHAVWAIQDWGFEAVVAPSFGDIFRNNSYQSGLLPVELPEETVNRLIEAAAAPNTIVTIDLETQTVRCGDLEASFDIDPSVKDRLLKGLDAIGLTLEHEDAIEAYEARRPEWLPRSVA
jgi:3-isopropylmalate/(R)-2-methylmalate dehydratase small subunit